MFLVNSGDNMSFYEDEDVVYDYLVEQFNISPDQARVLGTDWKQIVQFLAKEQNFLRGQITAYQDSIKVIGYQNSIPQGLSKL